MNLFYLVTTNLLCFSAPTVSFDSTTTDAPTSTLFLSVTSTTFDDAKAQCDGEGEGFFLATLTTQDEADSVFDAANGKFRILIHPFLGILNLNES